MTMFCQGNKAQLTAAATHPHSERECKLAPMQMSQRAKNVSHNFHHPRHFSEAQMLRWGPLTPKHPGNHRENSKRRRRVTHYRTLVKDTHTYLSVMASAREYWFIKSAFQSSHTVGNGWGPGAGVKAPVCKRGSKTYKTNSTKTVKYGHKAKARSGLRPN